MRMPFGRYRGVHLEKLPRSYLQWMVDNLADGDFHMYAARAKEALSSDEVRMEERAEDIDKMADEFLREHGFDQCGRER